MKISNEIASTMANMSPEKYLSVHIFRLNLNVEEISGYFFHIQISVSMVEMDWL